MVDARARRSWGNFAAGLAFCAAALVATAAAAMPSPRLKPPPPGPEYASRDDLARLKDIQKQLEKRSFSTARASADAVQDPMARNLAKWFYFYAEDPLVDLKDADAFLDEHPGWPAAEKIQSFVESRIPAAASPQAVLDFFATRDPLTGEGMMQLARAEFATGKPEAGTQYVKEAWKRFNFPIQVEQQLTANYSGYLSVDDHIARADRLLWAREATAAKRVIPRLPARERRMAEARAALILGAANASDLFYALKDDERLDPGVLLAAVRYYRRRDEEPRAITLAMQAPSDPALLRDAGSWWDERQLLMRWALENRRYEDAYAMAAGNGLGPGTQFAEAEFDAGWIALRFLNAPERAEIHFSALAGGVGAPISLSRAYYWLGRAAEARGDADIANARYRDAAKFIYTYYGQLAAERLGGAAAAAKFAPPIQTTAEDLARFSARPVAHALRILADLDDPKTFLIFSYRVDDELETPGEYVELARLADKVGATHAKVRAGKVGVGRNAFAPDAVYPLIDVPPAASRFAPAEIILGLSRQESEFNPRAYSRAGARGLMQLLPTTAEITAKKEGLRYSRDALLSDPQYNMTIGAAHLSHLFTRFNGSRIMTFAAYNAGPNRVDEWVTKYGDPRSAAIDPVDWVELIPFQETRNYVQRVLENTQIYRARLNEAPIAGRLSGDLELGGTQKRAGRLPGRKYAGTLPPAPARTIALAREAQLPETSLVEPPVAADETGPPTDEPSPDVLGSNPENALADADAADYIGDARRSVAASNPTVPAPKLADTKKSRSAGEKKPAASAASKAPARAISQPSPRPTTAPTPSAPTLTQTPSTAETPTVAAEVPSAAAPTMAPVDQGKPVAAPSLDQAKSEDGCQTYRDYIAEEEKDEASASDLNAGMLAELNGGGAACGGDKVPATPDANTLGTDE